MSQNLFPIHDKLLSRADKEKLLKQRSIAVWMTGLSGSGKSTIAAELEKQLHKKQVLCAVLDGDNVRTGINANLGFSDADRKENIRRIAEVNKLFLQNGVITINCFVSPTQAIRDAAKSIIGDENFIEVYVECPLEVCEQRDVKGLYKKARKGEIKDFTGISAPFEAPEKPAVIVHTAKDSLDVCVQQILHALSPRITF